MTSQVESLLPSFTKRMWLSGEILPLPMRSSTSALNSPLVMGRTSSSL